MQSLDLSSSSRLGMLRAHVFQPLDISFADNVSGDPLDFSPIISNRSNVLLNHYNNAEPSPPAIATDAFSCSPPEFEFFHRQIGPKTVKCCNGQLIDVVDNMPSFADEVFSFQSVNFYQNVTPLQNNLPTFHYPTPPSHNDSPPPSSQHAVSAPIPISPKGSPSLVDERFNHEPIVDDELNDWIERAATASSHKSSSLDDAEMSSPAVSSWYDGSPSPTAYKNQQEIFDEILRECEQKTICCEIEIRSSESVVSFEDSDDSFSVHHSDRFGTDDCSAAFLDLTPSTSNQVVRKKDQNRQAALRYRSKRKSQRSHLHAERRRLEAEHFRLTELVRDTQREVDYLRGFLAEIQQKAGTGRS